MSGPLRMSKTKEKCEIARRKNLPQSIYFNFWGIFGYDEAIHVKLRYFLKGAAISVTPDGSHPKMWGNCEMDTTLGGEEI